MSKRIVALVVGVLMSLGMVAAPALAFHPRFEEPNEPVISPHQHLINGQRVGPNACKNGPSIAFDHFHLNVHIGKPGLDFFRGDPPDGLLLVTSAACP